LDRFSKEIYSTVDEMSHSDKPRRSKTLRATDVIPPFDRSGSPSDHGRTDAEQPQAPPSEAGANEGGTESSLAPGNPGATAEPSPAACVEIPTYDLAENILAEQRRAAGRRRRGPGRTEDEPIASARATEVKASVSDLASQDLLELQRVVAEIVARDIQQLCRRPDGPAHIRL
jgi:hypothetical protein